jgi:PPOX class probable F420-dependent enzyme
MVSAAVAAAGEFGATARRRLEQNKLAWLTTVSSDGTPQPNPVWFIVDDDVIIIFSKPNQAKLKNVARHPQVAFNLEATETEEEITIITGTAEVTDKTVVTADLLDRYAAKYEQGMVGIKMTREEYEAAYTNVIRLTPAKVRGW